MKKNLLAITACLAVCLLLTACADTRTGTEILQPAETGNSAETTAAAETSEQESGEAVSDGIFHFRYFRGKLGKDL